MRRKLFGSTIALVLLVAMAQPAAAAITKVRDTTAREFLFAIDRNAGEVVRAWSVDSAQRPYFYSVYWQAGGDPPIRRTTSPDAFVGGLDLDNTRGALLSYWTYTGQANSYDVKLYDIAGSHAVSIPSGVNTSSSEGNVSVTENYLLFNRGPRRGPPKRVILVNLTTGIQTVVKVAPANGFVVADQVNGDFAVYEVCPANGRCVVHRYQISNLADTKLPNMGRAAYSSSVTPTGEVYYAIGHPTRCGVNTQIHHWVSGPHAPKIEQFANGIEVWSTWPFERLDMSIAVYFTRVVCQPRGNFRSGIYVTDG